MDKINIKCLIKKARENNFAIGSFNIVNFETLKAVIDAACETKSPVICQISEGALKYIPFEYIVPMAISAAKNAQIPIYIHLDHSRSVELCKKAIDAGFDSVMFDGSHLDIDSNIKKTLEVVEYAKSRNVAVEGEVGIIGGKEDDINTGNAIYASIDEATKFYAATKVDFLAVAFGTSHGVYKKEPKLNFEILDQARKITNAPLVMHGTSGVALPDIETAIKHGVYKVNVGTGLLTSYYCSLVETLNKNPQVFDLRKFSQKPMEAVKNKVKKYLKLFNSVNQI